MEERRNQFRVFEPLTERQLKGIYRKRRFRPIGISLAGMICDKVSLTLLPS